MELGDVAQWLAIVILLALDILNFWAMGRLIARYHRHYHINDGRGGVEIVDEDDYS